MLPGIFTRKTDIIVRVFWILTRYNNNENAKSKQYENVCLCPFFGGKELTRTADLRTNPDGRWAGNALHPVVPVRFTPKREVVLIELSHLCRSMQAKLPGYASIL